MESMYRCCKIQYNLKCPEKEREESRGGGGKRGKEKLKGKERRRHRREKGRRRAKRSRRVTHKLENNQVRKLTREA